jgi:hypothetical protein
MIKKLADGWRSMVTSVWRFDASNFFLQLELRLNEFHRPDANTLYPAGNTSGNQHNPLVNFLFATAAFTHVCRESELRWVVDFFVLLRTIMVPGTWRQQIPLDLPVTNWNLE